MLPRTCRELTTNVTAISPLELLRRVAAPIVSVVQHIFASSFLQDCLRRELSSLRLCKGKSEAKAESWQGAFQQWHETCM